MGDSSAALVELDRALQRRGTPGTKVSWPNRQSAVSAPTVVKARRVSAERPWLARRWTLSRSRLPVDAGTMTTVGDRA